MSNSPRLILASKSASRRAMLDAAGVVYESIPADIDERAVEAGLAGATPAEVAEALAVAKGAAVAVFQPGALVLGSDSLVVASWSSNSTPAETSMSWTLPMV